MNNKYKKHLLFSNKITLYYLYRSAHTHTHTHTPHITNHSPIATASTPATAGNNFHTARKQQTPTTLLCSRSEPRHYSANKRSRPCSSSSSTPTPHTRPLTRTELAERRRQSRRLRRKHRSSSVRVRVYPCEGVSTKCPRLVTILTGYPPSSPVTATSFYV